jgi:hypothetical protein
MQRRQNPAPRFRRPGEQGRILHGRWPLANRVQQGDHSLTSGTGRSNGTSEQQQVSKAIRAQAGASIDASDGGRGILIGPKAAIAGGHEHFERIRCHCAHLICKNS